MNILGLYQEPTKGHVAFIGSFEYVQDDRGDLYRAVRSSHPPAIGTNGYRMDLRWECYGNTAPMALALARKYAQAAP